MSVLDQMQKIVDRVRAARSARESGWAERRARVARFLGERRLLRREAAAVWRGRRA